MAAGFNGARLHEKVFEPRFLYHCDRLGYLVWGEQGNWGMDPSAPDGLKNFLPEWMEAVERDFNHRRSSAGARLTRHGIMKGASRMTTFWQLSIG